MVFVPRPAPRLRRLGGGGQSGLGLATTCCPTSRRWRTFGDGDRPGAAPAGRCMSPTSPPRRIRFATTWLKAAEQAGFTRTRDYNGARSRKASPSTRSRPAAACAHPRRRRFSRPAMRRPNLSVVTGALADPLILSRGAAPSASNICAAAERGRRAGRPRGDRRRPARSIRPLLLQLSGLGPADLLQSFGIEVAHDAAGGRAQSAGPSRRRLSLPLPAADPQRAAQALAGTRAARRALSSVPRRAAVPQRQPGRRLRPHARRPARMSTCSSISPR